MFKIVLLTLALTGLQALPISRRLSKAHHSLPEVQDDLTVPLSEGLRQGSEASRRLIVDLNTGLVQDYISDRDQETGLLSPRFGNGHGEMNRRHWLGENTAEEVPVQKNGGGWVRVEGQTKLPDGFRQGTEPSRSLPEGFRQGTERVMPIPAGFRQGTERFLPIPDEFRQGTEPSMRLQDGFRQGTEPSLGIPKGFRQGTERFMPIPDGFRQGTEPALRIPNGFRQGTEPTNPEAYREAAVFLKARKTVTIPDGFRQGTEPSNRIPDGFRQGTERFMPISDGFRQGTERLMPIPDGFRQGTERFMPIADGFRQGTERFMPIRDGFKQGTERFMPIPDGFRQGTERFMPIPDGFRQGTERFMPIPDGFRQGTERFMPIPEGFRQGTERFMPIPDGFRQGTERYMPIPSGFRQGTEPSDPEKYRQGTELSHEDAAPAFDDLPAVPFNEIQGFRAGAGPFMPVRDGDSSLVRKTLMPFREGFRQSMEPTDPFAHEDAALNDLPDVPSNQILEGFRPGAGPFMPVRDGDTQGTQGNKGFMPFSDGFRQGTGPSNPDIPLSFNDLPAVPSNEILEGFRPGAGPFMPVRDGDRSEFQPSNHIQASFNHVFEKSETRENTHMEKCNGEIINGRCYSFNPTPMPFLEAQDFCKSLNPRADLASVTDEDLHSRLVSMVTEGGQRDPVMTWLGGTVKKQRGAWVDGSEWIYSDWMPGQPNIHTDKPVCVEMFRMGETWWSAADCDLKRASVCAYPVEA